MLLSRIEMDISNRQTLRGLSSPHVLHAAVANCFPANPDEELSRSLWRVDSLAGKTWLLILSQEQPDFSAFARQFCRAGIRGESKSYDNLLARIDNGQEWRFRLAANPTHSQSTGKASGKRGKVYAHLTVEQQKKWLIKKAVSHGFDVGEIIVKEDGAEEVRATFEVTHSEHISFRRGDKYVSLGLATFEGLLRVTDKELFTAALTDGIGRAKAYGCGLLTIARP